MPTAGDWVVMGSPNVVRGGSHLGWASAGLGQRIGDVMEKIRRSSDKKANGELRKLLGYDVRTPRSVAEYLASRARKS